MAGKGRLHSESSFSATDGSGHDAPWQVLSGAIFEAVCRLQALSFFCNPDSSMRGAFPAWSRPLPMTVAETLKSPIALSRARPAHAAAQLDRRTVRHRLRGLRVWRKYVR